MGRSSLAAVLFVLACATNGDVSAPVVARTGVGSQALGVYVLSAVRTEHGSTIELLDEEGRSLGRIFAERTPEHRLLRITFTGVDVEHEDEGPGQPLELSTANALVGERAALLDEPLVASRLAELDLTFTTRPLQTRRPRPPGALRSVPQTGYNARTSNCSPYRVNGAGCGATNPPAQQVPLTEAQCPAAQWLWTGGLGYQSSTGNDKGNAYCSESSYWGTPVWGTYDGSLPLHGYHAVVQEIAGLWFLPASPAGNVGCNKNIRVCLGTPEYPAVGAYYGTTVPGCGAGGPGGCSVCWTARARPDNEALLPTDTCCTDEYCLLGHLTVDATHGSVSSDIDGIDCEGTTCEADYSDLAQLKLTRTDGYDDFTGWSGDCAGSGDTCTLNMGQLISTPPPMVDPVDHSAALVYDLRGSYQINGGEATPLPRHSSDVIDDGEVAGRFRVAMAAAGPYTWELSQGACPGLVSSETTAQCSFYGAPFTLRVTHVPSQRSREITVAPSPRRSLP